MPAPELVRGGNPHVEVASDVLQDPEGVQVGRRPWPSALVASEAVAGARLLRQVAQLPTVTEHDDLLEDVGLGLRPEQAVKLTEDVRRGGFIRIHPSIDRPPVLGQDRGGCSTDGRVGLANVCTQSPHGRNCA